MKISVREAIEKVLRHGATLNRKYIGMGKGSREKLEVKFFVELMGVQVHDSVGVESLLISEDDVNWRQI